MSDLGRRADGIERALAAGGRELDVYQQPGFTGRRAARLVPLDTSAREFPTELDPDPPSDSELRKAWS